MRRFEGGGVGELPFPVNNFEATCDAVTFIIILFLGPYDGLAGVAVELVYFE